jgi:hypothetical protein
MEFGELGQPTELAVLLVEEELKLTPEFVTTQHHQMVGHHALVLLLKVSPATHKFVILVIEHYQNFAVRLD